MGQQDGDRRRVKAPDGFSFRLERRGGQLFVNELPAQIRPLKGKKDIELVTDTQTVRMSGADYWE